MFAYSVEKNMHTLCTNTIGLTHIQCSVHEKNAGSGMSNNTVLAALAMFFPVDIRNLLLTCRKFDHIQYP